MPQLVTDVEEGEVPMAVDPNHYRHSSRKSPTSRRRDRHREREYERRRNEKRRRSKERERHERHSHRKRDRSRESHRSRDKRHSDSRDSKRRREDEHGRSTHTSSNMSNSENVTEDEDEIYRQEVEKELKQTQDEEALIEERRRRRQQILAKYQQRQGTQHAPPSSSPPHLVKETVNVIKQELKPELKKETDGETEGEAVSNSQINGSANVPAQKSKDSLPFEDDDDDDDDDDMDMFADSPTKFEEVAKEQLKAVQGRVKDNWDDPDGYYRFTIGEMFNDRYQIFSSYGNGVFSTVVRAKDLDNDNQEVALKIIRNNDTMYRSGLKEREMLQRLADKDPENRRHCVRLLDSFEYRNHLCLVLEPMDMNLRDVVKKYGKSCGISLSAVKIYAKQLFIALKHLKRCEVIHADIKPDNIVVNKARTTVKICDLGSASDKRENEITPYLVSRFYRAPEIMLGLPYDEKIDMWSVGTVLAELYTGKITFPGTSNNEMLKLHMDLKGQFPKKMLKKAMFSEQHFASDGKFLRVLLDPVSKKTIVRPTQIIHQTFKLLNIEQLPENEQKPALLLEDLLQKIFTLDPSKRISVEEALRHPFLTKAD